MKLLIPILSILIAGTASAQPLMGAKYVSMGSSYAAGPGVGLPDAASAACQRSSSNYAHLVASRRHLELVDVACSGAVTDNILVHGQYGLAPQIEAVTPETALVSILIGGNDVDYVGNLFGLSCRDKGGANCQVVDDAEVDRRFTKLPAALDRVVAEVRRRAPSARIVLIGYLPAVPAKAPGDCAALSLSQEDAERMRQVAVRLAQAIGGAAARNGTGIVRSWMIGVGHDACSAAPFVAGDNPPRNPGWSGPVAYHPTQAGMDSVAAALDEVIGH